jgi:hypothetical protein
VELGYLKECQDACERIRTALEPCVDRAECELRHNMDGGFWP